MHEVHAADLLFLQEVRVPARRVLRVLVDLEHEASLVERQAVAVVGAQRAHREMEVLRASVVRGRSLVCA